MFSWLCTQIGIVAIGVCLIGVPYAPNIFWLIAPLGIMGFAIGTPDYGRSPGYGRFSGMIDASMFPLMGYLVDIRHTGVYGSIYAIADAAFCFAFVIGPFVSGPLVKYLGFDWYGIP